MPDVYLLKGRDPLKPLRVRRAPTPPFIRLKGSIFKVKVRSKLIILSIHMNSLPWLSSVLKFTPLPWMNWNPSMSLAIWMP